MILSRRQFLATSAAFSAIAPTPALAQSGEFLKAAPSTMQLAPAQYPATLLWTFNGQSPGPELRFSQGAVFDRVFENGLSEPSSVHWHGVRVPNAMDGVPGLTQDPVPVGGRFRYEFPLPDAGTFWYHSHQNAVEQMARGLHGPLIVTEAEGPDVDRDEVIVLDDWRLTQQAAIDPEFNNPHDFSHAGRIGNFVTSNSRFDLTFSVQTNERLRLRLINAANARIFDLALQGIAGWIVALDGMPLDQPEPVERFTIAPAQRVDLIVDVTASETEPAYLVRIEQNEGFSQATFTQSGKLSDKRRDPAKPLQPNPVLALGQIDTARNVPLLMEGGAMGDMRAATLKGQEKPIGELAQGGMYWAFNGEVGLTEAPLVEVGRGETLRIPIQNRTVFPHTMHLHGHHFREILPDGTFGPLRDTLLVMPDERREIGFVADNPGDWLLHCHMLTHQTAGMKTWIKVST